MKRLVILCFMATIFTACSDSAETRKPMTVSENTPSALHVKLKSKENMENWKVTVTPTSISNEVKFKIEAIYVGENQIFSPSISVGGITVSTSHVERNNGFSVSDFNFSKDNKELEVKLSWTENNRAHDGKSIFEISAQ